MSKRWYVRVRRVMLRVQGQPCLAQTLVPTTGRATGAPRELAGSADGRVPPGHIPIQWVWAELRGLVFLTSDTTGNAKAGSLNSKPTMR